ncbi:ATP-binding protein [Acuticoccus mangrovi]|uniref:ATP-binding protein n=1 Tax=Acuticoccus mangrovi TaxID=2796142 RepID=A0A934IPR5_9HYPH|nr:ATP-binding protein [Acuticoccus mangrovi]MBJ3776348.1 ATP-binding protein [Acuticoccus mangrovi]
MDEVDKAIDLILTTMDDLDRMVEAVEAFGETQQLPMATVMHLNLILEELIANVINHGAAPGGPRVAVSVSRDGADIVGEVRDNGIAFDPLSRPAPDVTMPLDERPIGGLGVHLVRTLTRDLSYRRDDAHNVTRFVLAIEKG